MDIRGNSLESRHLEHAKGMVLRTIHDCLINNPDREALTKIAESLMDEEFMQKLSKMDTVWKWEDEGGHLVTRAIALRHPIE